ncbi:unnamed protein product [Rotaria sp. Silwood1]|nr:unnamed protein product [Rotaria sp. Silwood1]
MIPSQIPSMPNRMQSISTHISEYENLTTGQLGRRRRRRRQRQRRQQHREQHRQQQHRQQQHRQQRRQQQHGQRTEIQQQQQQQIRYHRYRRWSSFEREEAYWEWIGQSEYMEENISPVLETYNWETMHPNERQEIWEQNHLNELQRNTTPEQQDPWDYLEAFAALEHLRLIQHEIEQNHQINVIEELEAEELQQRHNADQI